MYISKCIKYNPNWILNMRSQQYTINAINSNTLFNSIGFYRKIGYQKSILMHFLVWTSWNAFRCTTAVWQWCPAMHYNVFVAWQRCKYPTHTHTHTFLKTPRRQGGNFYWACEWILHTCPSSSPLLSAYSLYLTKLNCMCSVLRARCSWPHKK